MKCKECNTEMFIDKVEEINDTETEETEKKEDGDNN